MIGGGCAIVQICLLIRTIWNECKDWLPGLRHFLYEEKLQRRQACADLIIVFTIFMDIHFVYLCTFPPIIPSYEIIVYYLNKLSISAATAPFAGKG